MIRHGFGNLPQAAHREPVSWDIKGIGKVLAGIVVDHLHAIAGGVGNEHTPAFCIEGGVIELAAYGVWYGDGSDCF